MPNNTSDEALKEAYMKYLTETPQKPTRPGFADIYTMAKKGAKKGKGEAVLGGIVGLIRALGSPEGLKMLTAATGNPYMKAALLKQAAEKERAIQREGGAYRSEMAPRMQQMGEYVRKQQALKAAAGLESRKQQQEQLEAITLTPEEKYKRETSLRKEVNKEIGDFPKVSQSYQRIVAVAKDPSGAGDLALIFNYMKMLDPASVVRESEFATAQNAAGVPERMRALWNRTLEGERLSPATRTDFLSKSQSLYNARNTQYKQTINSYRNLAELEGLDPERIFIKRGFVEKKGYQIGQTMKRGGKTYKYIGDDKWQEQ